MAKATSKFICQQCEYESIRWLGKCPNCDQWNTLVETVVSTSKSASRKSVKSSMGTKSVKLVDIKTSQTKRVSTRISELDRVLGGGLVPGQAILIAGIPGIGKSTLLLEVSDKLDNVLYVCGEESANQVAVRAQRLGISTLRDKSKSVSLLENTDTDEVVEQVQNSGVGAVIVDSIQTMTTSDLSGMAGSVGQVRESAFRLINACKSKDIPLFIVGHVTKEGTVAGPMVLSHMVDTVLWFEGDKTLTLRILRAMKNRFGPTDEVGIFEMQDKGLIPITDSSQLFLDKSRKNVAGSVITSIMQGTRPLLVEIQALVVPTKLPIPRRVAQGIDPKRLEMLLAVLTRRCGIPLYDCDVFVNIAGGIKVTETGSDLAVALTIASAYFNRAVSGKVVAVGEVGLLGEIREVIAQEKRIKEARRLGFTQVISSKDYKFLGDSIRIIRAIR